MVVDSGGLKELLIISSGSRLGCRCGSVGRVVASDTRDPRFESR